MSGLAALHRQLCDALRKYEVAEQFRKRLVIENEALRRENEFLLGRVANSEWLKRELDRATAYWGWR